MRRAAGSRAVRDGADAKLRWRDLHEVLTQHRMIIIHDEESGIQLVISIHFVRAARSGGLVSSNLVDLDV
eukprot:6174364-Pleurochrysis_carterae.AAC.1